MGNAEYMGAARSVRLRLRPRPRLTPPFCTVPTATLTPDTDTGLDMLATLTPVFTPESTPLTPLWATLLPTPPPGLSTARMSASAPTTLAPRCPARHSGG